MTCGLQRAGAVVCILALASGSCGPAQARVSGTIVDWGRGTGERPPPPPPSADAGTGLAPAEPLYAHRYLDHSDVIEARLCRSFGITVRITADGSDTVPRRVSVRVRHPLFTRPDGATSTEDDFPSYVLGGETGVGFTFDHLWEMQPGRWSIAVSANGVELGAKTFEVVRPPPGEPQSDCRDKPEA